MYTSEVYIPVVVLYGGGGGGVKSIHPSGGFVQRRGVISKVYIPVVLYRGVGFTRSIYPSGGFVQRGGGGVISKVYIPVVLYRLVLSSMQCVCVCASPARTLAHIIMSLLTGTVADKLVSAL